MVKYVLLQITLTIYIERKHFHLIDAITKYLGILRVFLNQIKFHWFKVFIFHNNVRSYSKPFDKILIYLESVHFKVHVIVLYECWLDEGERI